MRRSQPKNFRIMSGRRGGGGGVWPKSISADYNHLKALEAFFMFSHMH